MGPAGAFELHLPPLSRRVQHLSEVHGGSVAQLAREVAKLVAAVAVRRRLGARQDLVAATVFGEIRSRGLRAGRAVSMAGSRRPRPAWAPPGGRQRGGSRGATTSSGGRSSSASAAAEETTSLGDCSGVGLAREKQAPDTSRRAG